MSVIFVASRARVLLKELFLELNLQPSKVKCLFVSTAGETEENLDYMNKDKAAWRDFGVSIDEYSFTGKTSQQIATALEAVNMIYVGGGNTIHLLNEARKSGAIEVIGRFVIENKIIYVGSSAGAMLAGKDLTYMRGQGESKGISLNDYRGLNLINFQPWVHTGMPERVYLKIKRYVNEYFSDELRILLTNNQGILVKDGWMKLLQSIPQP